MKLTEQQKEIASNLFISRMSDYTANSREQALADAKKQARACITFAKVYTETESEHDKAQEAVAAKPAAESENVPLTENVKEPVMETGLEPEPEEPNVVDVTPGTPVIEDTPKEDESFSF
jgi:hypothetical protein